MLGLNSVFFVYYLLAYPLRHSHIWISYGRVGNHILMIPAQHQIHHSVAPEHIDKNLGGMFAFWDWMFGTLYVPEGREEIVFGLADEDSSCYQYFWRLYILPFQRANVSNQRLLLVVGILVVAAGFASATRGLNFL